MRPHFFAHRLGVSRRAAAFFLTAALRATLLLAAFTLPTARAEPTGRAGLIEVHQRLELPDAVREPQVALTLDACGGGYDQDLIATLVRLRVPATIFATRIWLDHHPAAVRELLAHPDLFEIENHGERHVPAVVGRSLYGMKSPSDLAGVEREVTGGARAVTQATGHAPTWYRGAGAAYDTASLQAIQRLGYRVAGFSLNADDGALLAATMVARRLRQAKPGDIVIAHMNHPSSGTARGFEAALPELMARGLRFVRLSQAAGVVQAREQQAFR